jgi:hypothetical protein
MNMRTRRHLSILPAVLLAVLLAPPVNGTRSASLQTLLQGDWVRADRRAALLTFVPTGGNTGQVAFDDGTGADYHFYRVLGKDRIKIWDLKVVAHVRVQGDRLLLRMPGRRHPTVYVRR